MQTSIVIVSGSVINASTAHLNGIWHLIWRYISKPVLGGHPVLSGHYSIARGCPLNTGFSVLRLEHKQNSFRIRIYSFGIKTINTFIHSRSSLENHSRFQTKMGKVYTSFQIRTVQKPFPLGRHILIIMACTRELQLYRRVPLVTTVKIHKCEMTPEYLHECMLYAWLAVAKTWVQSHQKRKM